MPTVEAHNHICCEKEESSWEIKQSREDLAGTQKNTLDIIYKTINIPISIL